MSEVKRWDMGFRPNDEVKMCESLHGRWVEWLDYESERLAHEETKRNHASVVERLFYSEREQLRLDKELEETKKRLEELEDAVHDKMNWLPGKYSIGRQMQLDRIYAEAEKSSRGRE